MNYILGSHGQLDRLADRNMQLVDLALAFGMLQLPHPLLSDHIYLLRVVRRPRHSEEKVRAPDKHDHGQSEGDDAPEDLQAHRALYRRGHLGFGTPPVTDGEIENAEEYSNRKEGRHGQQEVEQMIHHRRDAGRLHWK